MDAVLVCGIASKISPSEERTYPLALVEAHVHGASEHHEVGLGELESAELGCYVVAGGRVEVVEEHRVHGAPAGTPHRQTSR